MHSNIVKSELVDSKVVEQLEPIVVQACIQIVVPTEKELFCIIIEKIQQLDKSIVGTKEDMVKLTASLLNIKEQLPSENILDKKLISVKEFEATYSIAEESQRKLRGRLKDPLPFVQLQERGNILYNVKTIDSWMENYIQKRA
ncbi:hypothetical protein [Sulfurimonas sp. NW9]|uniref:hypothetical protein n=1 Tax=Sulfurimonas sp. NW9 TaxID=2922728 RepID=UPI003DA9AFC3